jgi:hypothetical protein
VTDTNPTTLAQDSVILIKKKLALMMTIPQPVVADLGVEALADWATDQLVLRLKTHILGEQLPSHTETASTGVPATWWQHYKHDYADRWWMRRFTRRWPVKTRTITLTATWEEMAGYPWHELRTELPMYMGAAVRIPLGSSSSLDLGRGVVDYWTEEAYDQ